MITALLLDVDRGPIFGHVNRPDDREAKMISSRRLSSLLAEAGFRIESLRYVSCFPVSLRRLRFIVRGLEWCVLGG